MPLDYIPTHSFGHEIMRAAWSAVGWSRRRLESPPSCVVFAYSCRSLFETLLTAVWHEELTVLVTPIHHTSFVRILERHVKPQNIIVLEMCDNYTKIARVPERRADVCVVTHLFGRDIDLSALEAYARAHAECLILEDRVQGGTLATQRSSDLVDVSMYSCGMDKLPCALGGGYGHFSDRVAWLERRARAIIEQYPCETEWSRLVCLLKKVPTYALYNTRAAPRLLTILLKVFRINLDGFVQSYRRRNPGFAHEGYNLNPSAHLRDAMLAATRTSCTWQPWETLFLRASRLFNTVIDRSLLPHAHGARTPYNTIVARCPHTLVRELSNRYVPCLRNPTYATFSIEYEGRRDCVAFLERIVYVPCLATLTNDEICALASLLNRIQPVVVSERLTRADVQRLRRYAE